MLLGVAGIDVPIFEFDRLLQPFLLGVGGYAFIVDHNGNIVTHPDFRPIVSSLKLSINHKIFINFHQIFLVSKKYS